MDSERAGLDLKFVKSTTILKVMGDLVECSKRTVLVSSLKAGFKSPGIMGKSLIAGLMSVTGFAAVSAQGAVIYNVDSAPEVSNVWTIGQPTSTDLQNDVATVGAYYSDDTTFSGFSVNAGTNGTTKYTALLADDITTTATSSFTLGQFSWSVANGAAVAQTISPYIRFYDTSGANGGPGVLLGGLNFNGISVPAGNVSGFFYNASSQAITLPTSFWAAEFASTTGTAAQAAKIGQGTFNPPDIGSSQDKDFSSTSVGTTSSSFVSANPAGTVAVSPFAGAPVANFEWEFNPVAAVPEPITGTSLLLVTSVGLLGRRRRAVA